MKYLKLFENRDSLDEIKTIEHILTDEGIILRYDNVGDSLWTIRIHLHFSDGFRNILQREWNSEKYLKKVYDKILNTDFFEEYIDRLQDIFKEIRCGQIQIITNGVLIGVVNKNGWFPIQF